MYSFEGQFRRLPQQNLGGASVKRERNELLRIAHADRQRREEERRRHSCCIIVQSCVRSFLARQRFKHEQRAEFDVVSSKHFTSEQRWIPSLVDLKELECMLLKLIYFYDPRKDLGRLVFLSRCFVLNKHAVISAIARNEEGWHWKMKRLLLLSVRSILNKTDVTVHIRLPQIFLIEIPILQPGMENALHFVQETFLYLAHNGYYSVLRMFMEYKAPSLVPTQSNKPPVPVLTDLIKLMAHPIMIPGRDREYNTIILNKMIETFFLTPYSEVIKFYVLPTLSRMGYIQFEELLQTVKIYCMEKPPSTWLLNSLLTLQPHNFLLTCSREAYSDYFHIIAYQAMSFFKLQLDDDDVDSDSDNELERYPTRMSTEEYECALNCINLLNDYERISSMITRLGNIETAKDRAWIDSVISSISIVGFYLSCSNPKDRYKHRFLTMIALQPQFVKRLWYMVRNMKRASAFGSSHTYFEHFCAAVSELDIHEMLKFVPLIHTFCHLFSLLIITFQDSEIFKEEDEQGYLTCHSLFPFTRRQMIEMCHDLKEFAMGLIELAFPDFRLDATFRQANYNLSTPFSLCSSTSQFGISAADLCSHLFKELTVLVRHLYVRDLRIQFCPSVLWITNRCVMTKISGNLLSMNHRRIDRLFYSVDSEYASSEEPPLTTRELRFLTVIRYVPFLISFTERVLLLHNSIQKDKTAIQGHSPYLGLGYSFGIVIRRQYLYEDAFEKLNRKNGPDVRCLLKIRLKNIAGLEEAGVDGGGLFREFLTELLKTAFDPNRGFFRLTTNNELYPNPYVQTLHADFQEHYFFIGRMLGKALYENLMVELPLADFFLSSMVRGVEVTFHHLASLDPLLHKNIMYLKNYDGNVAELGLDFTIANNDLGSTQVVELKPNGAEIQVTNENKMEYIRLVVEYRLNKQIAKQCSAFRKGLVDVINIGWLQMFSYKELKVLISGAESPVDVADLKQHTVYSGGFSSDHKTIQMFWHAVENFSDRQKSLLLKFVTSCSRPPLFGFKELEPPFCIQRGGSLDRFPTASTCMNLLKIPEYTDYNVLRERLLYAIQSGSGFELS